MPDVLNTSIQGADRPSTGGDIEQKYIFLTHHQKGLLEWLRFSFNSDSEFPTGPVSTIYYDTPQMDLYYEKRNSNYLKSKIRLRWYENLSQLPRNSHISCYLELKKKVGVFRSKIRQNLSFPARLLADDPFSKEEILDLPTTFHELSGLTTNFLVPVVLINYRRFRFFDPATGSRIALDTSIKCPTINSKILTGLPPVHLDVGVLEIKGQERHLLPSLSQISPYLTREAFSKYARCCEQLMLPLGRRL